MAPGVAGVVAAEDHVEQTVVVQVCHCHIGVSHRRKDRPTGHVVPLASAPVDKRVSLRRSPERLGLVRGWISVEEVGDDDLQETVSIEICHFDGNGGSCRQSSGVVFVKNQGAFPVDDDLVVGSAEDDIQPIVAVQISEGVTADTANLGHEPVLAREARGATPVDLGR